MSFFFHDLRQFVCHLKGFLPLTAKTFDRFFLLLLIVFNLSLIVLHLSELFPQYTQAEDLGRRSASPGGAKLQEEAQRTTSVSVCVLKLWKSVPLNITKAPALSTLEIWPITQFLQPSF